MDQVAGPGGFFMIFRFLRYLQYVPYIAIGITLITIAIWIVFAKKKLKWAKILAIVLTIIAVVAVILSFAVLFFGRNLPRGDFPEEFRGDRPNFQDRGDFKPDQYNQRLEIEFDSYDNIINELNSAAA
jgi:glucan phosphoethanolaminetransferase (alkaline phosphatase superfamily)